MKIVRMTIICAIALTAISVSGYAAQVDKEVEVTRAYVPEIKPATKLHLTPDTSDDSYIKPDIDYSITPISIETELETELYEAVNLDLERYEPMERFYTKIGVGLPFQSVVDLYATPVSSKSGYIVGYFNQDGRFAKIENDYDEKNSSTQNHLKGGFAAGKYISTKVLEGHIAYNNDKWSRYATAGDSYLHPLYQSVDFRGRFADSFTDLSRWNYAVDVTAGQFWSRAEYDNFRYGVDGLFGRELFGGVMNFAVEYDGVSGNSSYLNTTLGVGARYIHDGDVWSVRLGAKYYNDRVSYDDGDVEYIANKFNYSAGYGDESNVGNYIIPDVEISLDLNGDKCALYTKAYGELLHRDFATLSGENPYLTPGLFATESGVEYNFDLGLKGTFAKGLVGYNLFAEYSSVRNNLYWAYLERELTLGEVNNEFIANYSTISSFSINAEMEYMPNSNLIIGADLRVGNYINDSDQPFEDGLPATELRLDAKYIVGAWRLGLSGEMLGKREYSMLYESYAGILTQSTSKIPTTFNLGLSADYRLKSSMIIFAELDNILNDDLYKWVGYREYGINVMMGIKMEF